jgi:hypothetical protein
MVILSSLASSGCAPSLEQARSSFYNGKPGETVVILSEADDLKAKDRLLKLMEEGVAYHQLKKYEQSAEVLLEAADLIDEQDYISVSQQAGSLVANEWVTEYKGEYSERLWVHTYLMMNFLLLNRHESALVEAKRALKVFEAFSESLSKDHFSRALVALCFENLSEYNDAYIEYKILADQLSSQVVVARELSRMAAILGFLDEVEKYKNKIPEKFDLLTAEEKESELVLFVSLGRGPVKESEDVLIPPGVRFSIPRYSRKKQVDAEITVFEEEDVLPNSIITTQVFNVASDSLEARRLAILAKETARVTSKEMLVRELEDDKDTELLGALARVLFMIMEEADTRCWHTLPAVFKMVKVPISSGVHNIRVQVTPNGNGSSEEFILPGIETFRGRKTFYAIRLLD